MEAVTFKKLVKGHAYSVTALREVSSTHSLFSFFLRLNNLLVVVNGRWSTVDVRSV